MSRNLGIIAIIGIILFLALMGPADSFAKSPEFGDSLLGRLLISLTALSVIVPWGYAIEKARSKKESKWFWLCFLFWPVAPYYLIKINKAG